jgi:glycosyltransferase involved in cell wall biosynthesis
MIPTFNSAPWLEATLRSVLAQAPAAERMQIEVVDDCSTKDDPAEVVARLGSGRIAFYRRPANGGVVANFNTCLLRSRGGLIHILHGDDCVRPGFYDRVAAAAATHPEIGLFATRSFWVDENNQITALSHRYIGLEQGSREPGQLLDSNHLSAPGVVVRREAYEREGGFRPDLVHCADWEMWVRQIVREGGLFINEPLACYRLFSGNDSSKLSRTAENLRDRLRLEPYLAAYSTRFSSPRWRRQVAAQAIEQRLRFRLAGDPVAAAANDRLWREVTPLGQRWLRRAQLFIQDRMRRWAAADRLEILGWPH